MTSRLRVAVVGAGAIGAFYGTMLEKAGVDVSFVARGATCLLYTSDAADE